MRPEAGDAMTRLNPLDAIILLVFLVIILWLLVGGAAEAMLVVCK
jgi:hypothetical protein